MRTFVSLTFSFICISIALFPTGAFAGTFGKPPYILSLNRGLVAHYTFDGKDMTRNIGDSSGYGNNGHFVTVTATTTAQGKFGQALNFVDPAQETDFGNDPSVQISGDFTLSFWINTDSLSDTYGSSFFCKCQYPNTGFSIYNNAPDTLNIKFDVYDGTYHFTQFPRSLINDGKWHQLVGVHSGTTLYLYLDNVLMDTNVSATMVQDTVNPLGAGGSEAGIVIHKLIMDDMRLYNRALSASELSQLYSFGQAKLGISDSKPTTGLNRGLVAHYTFDGKDMVSNVRDSSGNGNHGILYFQTPTSTVAGKIGQGLKFEGIYNEVVAGDISALNGLTTVTFSTWEKFTESGGGASEIHFFDKSNCTGGGAGGGPFEFATGISSPHKAEFVVYNSSGAQFYLSNPSSTSVDDGKWHHVVGIYDGSIVSIWVDGVLENSNNIGLVSVMSNSNNVILGGQCEVGAPDYPFNGTLDDVRIYNRALSATEIKQLYLEGTGVKQGVTPALPTSSASSGLVGHWTFDGKDTNWRTNTVSDTSGNGNTGTLKNMSTTSTPTGGKFGQALFFDGDLTKSVSDYVDLGNAASLQITGSFTASAWVNATGFPGNGTNSFFGKTDNVNPDQYSWDMGTTNDNGPYNFYVDVSGNGTSEFLQLSNTVAVAGGWYFVTAVYSSTGPSLSMYVNGVLDNGSTLAFNPGGYSLPASLFNSSVNMTIGRKNSPSTDIRPWQGKIDEVRLYNRALSATEVKQLYNMGR